MATEDHATCIARGRAYDLLATGLLDGLREDRAAHFAAVPALGPHIDPQMDADAWAAAHHTALSLEVPPFAHAFVSEGGTLDDGAALRGAFASGGFGALPADVPLDHCGLALRYLSWLSGAEADAIADGQTAARAQIQQRAAAFIDAHLGRWLPALAVALGRSAAHAFFVELGALSAELVVAHRATLPEAASSWSLPTIADPLEHPDTRLADLARHLTTPALAGGLLTRSALGRIGRETQVPKGFGSRALMLTNLLKSASEYGALGSVLEELEREARAWEAAYTELGAGVWAERAAQTVGMLQQMARMALKE